MTRPAAASRFRKPRPLHPGDRVAILSPCWGGPATFPGIYELGLQVLRDVLHLEPVEFPTARMPAADVYAHPEKRAADINAAFADDSIVGIIATIGGDDSVRILRHLDTELIARHPKLLMGYSDVTTLLTYINLLGNVTVHGPSVMAGLSQAHALGPQYIDHLRCLLLDNPGCYSYRPYDRYSVGYPNWAQPETLGKTHPSMPNPGWDWLQKGTRRTGYLWGGCVEVLEFLKGTDYWPDRSFFDDKFLLLETSEEKPPPRQVMYNLRNYATQTILDRIQGLLIGRPRGYSADEKRQVREFVSQIVIQECGRTDIPIILDFDAGHTDPQFVLPFGIRTEIDPAQETISLAEPLFDVD